MLGRNRRDTGQEPRDDCSIVVEVSLEGLEVHVGQVDLNLPADCAALGRLEVVVIRVDVGDDCRHVGRGSIVACHRPERILNGCFEATECEAERLDGALESFQQVHGHQLLDAAFAAGVA